MLKITIERGRYKVLNYTNTSVMESNKALICTHSNVDESVSYNLEKVDNIFKKIPDLSKITFDKTSHFPSIIAASKYLDYPDKPESTNYFRFINDSTIYHRKSAVHYKNGIAFQRLRAVKLCVNTDTDQVFAIKKTAYNLEIPKTRDVSPLVEQYLDKHLQEYFITSDHIKNVYSALTIRKKVLDDSRLAITFKTYLLTPYFKKIPDYPERIESWGEIFFSASMALLKIHEKKCLHRDIKPSNIIISEDRLTYIDYGLAYKSGTTLDLSFTLIEDTKDIPTGTPGFIAPEILELRHYSIKSDIYALGKTFLCYLSKAKIGYDGYNFTTGEVSAINQSYQILFNVPDKDPYPYQPPTSFSTLIPNPTNFNFFLNLSGVYIHSKLRSIKHKSEILRGMILTQQTHLAKLIMTMSYIVKNIIGDNPESRHTTKQIQSFSETIARPIEIPPASFMGTLMFLKQNIRSFIEDFKKNRSVDPYLFLKTLIESTVRKKQIDFYFNLHKHVSYRFSYRFGITENLRAYYSANQTTYEKKSIIALPRKSAEVKGLLECSIKRHFDQYKKVALDRYKNSTTEEILEPDFNHRAMILFLEHASQELRFTKQYDLHCAYLGQTAKIIENMIDSPREHK